jgi:hypothetical protein
MRITSAGRVGIGTSSPSSILHVAGGTGSTIRNTASAGSSWFVGTNVDSYILHNESNTPMLFTTNATERMRIDANGRVNINTTGNNFHRLVVEENTNNGGTALFNANSNTAGPGLTFGRSRAGSTAVVSGDLVGQIILQGYDGVANFGQVNFSANVDGAVSTGSVPTRLIIATTPSGSVTPLERMRITIAGFVGINTSSPSAVLNVVGHNEFTLGLTAQTSSTQTAILNQPVAILANTSSAAGNGMGIRYQIADTGGVARTAGGIGTVATAKDASSVTADMYFYTGTTPTERMRIDSAGNVGIGTSSPGALLNVVANTTTDAVRITQTGTGNAFVVEDSANPDNSSFTITAAGKVGIGVAPFGVPVTLAVYGTDAMLVPAGLTSERPGLPAPGYFRFNATTSSFEGYNGTAWGSIGGGATGGGTDAIFYNNGQTVTTDYTIPAGQNAGTFGPVTVNSGVTVTVPSGSTWSIV